MVGQIISVVFVSGKKRSWRTYKPLFKMFNTQDSTAFWSDDATIRKIFAKF